MEAGSMFEQPKSGENTLKVEAVIVCKDYSDFLLHTLPENMELLDRVVVVTHPSDKATQSLCHKYGVDCIETEIMHDEGDAFNKGRAINLGLSHLRHEGWLIHMDSDVLLPHGFRNRLRQAKLEPKNIYGADRLNICDWDEYQRVKDKLVPQFGYRCLVTPLGDLQIGSRLLHNEYGWCPIGYFQLWHSSMRRSYPIIHGSAEHADVLFAVQWERRDRILLPEFFVYHLSSEKNAPIGINWKGRKTKTFGPEKKNHWGPDGHHHHHHHHCPYCQECAQ
jgi:hypothetical protein